MVQFFDIFTNRKWSRYIFFIHKKVTVFNHKDKFDGNSINHRSLDMTEKDVGVSKSEKKKIKKMYHEKEMKNLQDIKKQKKMNKDERLRLENVSCFF